jgi:hypothetical protein
VKVVWAARPGAAAKSSAKANAVLALENRKVVMRGSRLMGISLSAIRSADALLLRWFRWGRKGQASAAWRAGDTVALVEAGSHITRCLNDTLAGTLRTYGRRLPQSSGVFEDDV